MNTNSRASLERNEAGPHPRDNDSLVPLAWPAAGLRLWRIPFAASQAAQVPSDGRGRTCSSVGCSIKSTEGPAFFGILRLLQVKDPRSVLGFFGVFWSFLDANKIWQSARLVPKLTWSAFDTRT